MMSTRRLLSRTVAVLLVLIGLSMYYQNLNFLTNLNYLKKGRDCVGYSCSSNNAVDDTLILKKPRKHVIAEVDSPEVSHRMNNNQTTISTPTNKKEIIAKNHGLDGADSRKTMDQCQPLNNILFLKTHKTGSSTMTSIFQRFGFHRNLTFALPKHSHIISRNLFERKLVAPGGEYDMLVNHVRYNRKEMAAVMKPDTKYITILRDPATQIESVFGYFRLYRHLNLSKDKNPFGTFISRPQYYWNKFEKGTFARNHMRNPSSYDLGLEPLKQSNSADVNTFIGTISNEFDLVLLQEYFNESLLLLKKLLCWDIDDVVYIIKGVRLDSLRSKLSDSVKRKSRDWNSADVKLYDFFNATFWDKVAEYGPEFDRDLKIFTDKLNKTFNECTIVDEKPKVTHREYTYKINPVFAQKCNDMLLSDAQFTKKIKTESKRPIINNSPPLH